MSVTNEVSKLSIFNDSNEVQLKKSSSIFLTFEVSKLFKFKETNEWQL